MSLEEARRQPFETAAPIPASAWIAQTVSAAPAGASAASAARTGRSRSSRRPTAKSSRALSSDREAAPGRWRGGRARTATPNRRSRDAVPPHRQLARRPVDLDRRRNVRTSRTFERGERIRAQAVSQLARDHGRASRRTPPNWLRPAVSAMSRTPCAALTRARDLARSPERRAGGSSAWARGRHVAPRRVQARGRPRPCRLREPRRRQLPAYRGCDRRTQQSELLLRRMLRWGPSEKVPARLT